MDNPQVLQDQEKDDRDDDGQNKDGENVTTLGFQGAVRGHQKISNRTSNRYKQWMEQVRYNVE
jgi:hypothetical protein